MILLHNILLKFKHKIKKIMINKKTNNKSLKKKTKNNNKIKIIKFNNNLQIKKIKSSKIYLIFQFKFKMRNKIYKICKIKVKTVIQLLIIKIILENLKFVIFLNFKIKLFLTITIVMKKII